MRFLLVLAGFVIAKDFCYETENKAKLFDVISFAMKRTKKRDLVLEVMFDNEGKKALHNPVEFKA